jgi:hypothetical protein
MMIPCTPNGLVEHIFDEIGDTSVFLTASVSPICTNCYKTPLALYFHKDFL